MIEKDPAFDDLQINQDRIGFKWERGGFHTKALKYADKLVWTTYNVNTKKYKEFGKESEEEPEDSIDHAAMEAWMREKKEMENGPTVNPIFKIIPRPGARAKKAEK